jgi:hypothetical protein
LVRLGLVSSQPGAPADPYPDCLAALP